MVEKQPDQAGETNKAENISDLGETIIQMLSERTENPSEAFVLLQRLSILLWYQYNIDWREKEGQQVASTKKQRYLDFVSELIDILTTESEKS